MKTYDFIIKPYLSKHLKIINVFIITAKYSKLF